MSIFTIIINIVKRGMHGWVASNYVLNSVAEFHGGLGDMALIYRITLFSLDPSSLYSSLK